jgi:hypothetical protein
MGAGRGIGGILQGLAQGFLEAKAEDKIKVQQDKDTATLQKRETAKLMLNMPGLRPEAQTTILAFLSGQGGGAEKDFLELAATSNIPGRVIPDIQSGVSPVGGAAVNQEGKLDVSSPTNVAIGAADRESPIPLQGPPASSFAPLEDFSIGQPQGAFETQEEQQDAALLLEERKQRIGVKIREEETRADDIKRFQRMEGLGLGIIKTHEIDPQSELAKVVMNAATMSADLNNSGPIERIEGYIQNRSTAQTEIMNFMSTLPMHEMSPEEAVELAQSFNPLAFAVLPGGTEGMLRQAGQLRLIAQDEELTREYNKTLRKFKLQSAQNDLEISQATLASGGADLEELLRLEDTLGKTENAIIKEIGSLYLKIEEQNKDFSPKSDALVAQIQDIILAYQEQLNDKRSRRQELSDRINIVQGKSIELDDVTEPRGPTTSQIVARAKGGDLDAWDLLPMSNPSKRNHMVKILAGENTGVVFNELMRLSGLGDETGPIPENEQISGDDIDQLTKEIDVERRRQSLQSLGNFFN